MPGIVAKKRGDDWQVYLVGAPAMWGCGVNLDAAIGNLVRSWPEQFGVEHINDGDSLEYAADVVLEEQRKSHEESHEENAKSD